MPDYKKAFKQSIIELCESSGKQNVSILDKMLQQQDKSDEEVVSGIISAFPEFITIFSSNLKKYASTF